MARTHTGADDGGRAAPDARERPLDETEQRFRLMADAVPQIVWVTDAEGRVEFFNKQWVDYTGVPYEPTTAAAVAATFVHPDDGAATVAAFDVARRTGRTFAVEHRIRSAAGDYRWFLVRAEPYRDPATGEIVRWFGASVDIHDRRASEAALRASEARQAFLLALQDRLLPLTDPDAVQFEAARALGEHLGASRVGYAEIEVDGEHSRVTRNYTRGVHGIEGRYRVADYSPALLVALRAGRTVARGDVAGDLALTDAERAAHAALRVGASVDLPLVRGGRLVAVLFAHFPGPHAWTPDELTLLADVAARTWDAVERARAEGALRASESRYRTLFEAIDEGYLLAEVLFDDAGQPVDLRYLEANPAATRMTRTAYVGRRLLEIDPNFEPYWLEIWGRVALTGAGERLERYAAPLGAWFDFYVTRVGGEGSRRVAVVFQDITTRKRAETERERLLAESGQARVDADAARAEAERTTQQLQDQAVELELQAEELQATASQLEERTAEAEHARRLADAERARATDILEATADAYFALDADFRIVAVNAAMERATGLGRGALLGRVFWDMFPATVGTAYERHYRAAATEGKTARFTDAYDDGRLALVSEADVYPVAGGGVAVFWRDITARVQAEAERERLLEVAEAARAEADAANDAKSGFLATMSHELRTPVNAVIGYAQLLELGLAGPLTEQQRAYLERLAGSARHLRALVDDVLDLSKIEAGETRVAHADGMTGAAVSAALDAVTPTAAARGVRLVDARRDEAGVPFVGDEDRVRQVALNLLSNAVKFTPRGGSVTVTSDLVVAAPPAATQLRGEGPWSLVRVADTGIGIVPEEQGRIFEPFHQVDGGHTRAAGGTGLGLAISRRLARLMGGDLSVESVPGTGSTFTLWLPAARHDTERAAETAGARSVQAERDLTRLETPGLGEVGELLHRSVSEVIAAYTDRLRADPAIPRGAAMTRVQLEDHAISLLADLAQSLVIVEDVGPEAFELLKDGSAIQRTIAEAHGARRHSQGWDEAALRRDQAIFREEVERAVRAGLKPGIGAVEEAVHVLLRLIDRGHGIARRAWRRAAYDAMV